MVLNSSQPCCEILILKKQVRLARDHLDVVFFWQGCWNLALVFLLLLHLPSKLFELILVEVHLLQVFFVPLSVLRELPSLHLLWFLDQLSCPLWSHAFVGLRKLHELNIFIVCPCLVFIHLVDLLLNILEVTNDTLKPFNGFIVTFLLLATLLDHKAWEAE